MKKSRFTEAQMVILREADRRPVPEVAKQHGVSAQTVYSWRKHFGTLEPADVKRLRQLEQEQRALEEDGGRSRSGDRRAPGDHAKKMVGARVRRQQVAYARRRGLSSRRACAVLSVARSTLGYVSRLRQRDAPALAVMRELAGQYPRYGYRKIRVFLARRGHLMSAQRAYRLWRQAGLQVPRRRPRRRVAFGRPRPLAPTAMNHVWAYDFVFDTCADGRSLKCLTVVDEFTRECLAIDVAGSIRSGRVIEVLGQLVSFHGAPRYLRSDNGPEFIATALLRWLQTVEIDTGVHRSGQALAEWHGRVVQREVPERMSIPRVVSESDGGQDRDRTLAATLQRRTSSHESRRPHPRRVQEADGDDPRLVRREPKGRHSPVISGPKKPGRSA